MISESYCYADAEMVPASLVLDNLMGNSNLHSDTLLLCSTLLHKKKNFAIRTLISISILTKSAQTT